LKIALVHDWLNGMRGGEKCLEVMCELFPQAHLHALFHEKGKMSPTIEAMNIRTSFVQKLPFVRRKYRLYLPLFPKAIESLDFSEYDLVISLSHCVSKGAVAREGAKHVCYCFTPMRYVWDMYEHYFGKGRGGFAGKLMPLFAPRLRRWDVASSARVTRFVAISENVRERIKRIYNRDADVIYPPVDCELFKPSGAVKDYYLIISALVPYKRVDVAIEAFRRSGRRLVIIGVGQSERGLRKMRGGNIDFLGWKPDEEIARYYASCRAFIFPGVEDFGIAPLEAQAAGRPVVAFGRGGALETVVPPDNREGRKPTGIFFREQTPEALNAALDEFENREDAFDPNAARENALRFDRKIFKKRVEEYFRPFASG
jgi:glycosyltransferase involved in cell wall biosynthesis